MAETVDVSQLCDMLECNICLEQYVNPRMLKCAHEFCKECLEDILVFQDDGSATIQCPLRCEQKTVLAPNETVCDLKSSYIAKKVLEAFNPESKMPMCIYCKRKRHVTVYCCTDMWCDACCAKYCIISKTHQKFDLGFNRRQDRVEVMCSDHKSLCSHIRGKKPLCVYCLRRVDRLEGPVMSIDKVVDLLRTAFEERACYVNKLVDFKEETRKSIDLAKEVLVDALRQRKEQCMARYADYLKEEEHKLLKAYDDLSSSHMASRYPYVMERGMCENFSERDHVELFLGREHYQSLVDRMVHGDSVFKTDIVKLSENFDFLGVAPLGSIEVSKGEDVSIKSPIVSTFTHRFESVVKPKMANSYAKVLGDHMQSVFSWFSPPASGRIEWNAQSRSGQRTGDVESVQLKYRKDVYKILSTHNSLGDLQGCLNYKLLINDVNPFYLDVNVLPESGKESASKHVRKIEFLPKYRMKLYFSKEYVCDVFLFDMVPGWSDKTYSKIIKHIEKFNYAAALDLCSKEINQAGEHEFRALLLRGTLRFLMSDFKSAKKDLDKILLLEPDATIDSLRTVAATILVEIHHYYSNEPSWDTVLSLLNSASVTNQYHPNVYCQWGRACMYMRRLSEACGFFKASISIDPMCLESRLHLIRCLKLMHQDMPSRVLTDEARQLTNESIRRFGQSSEMLCEYALFKALGMYAPEEYATFESYPLGNNGETSYAIDALIKSAIEMDPNSPEPHIAKGYIYLGVRNYGQAENSFKKSLEIAATATAYEELGKIAMYHKSDYKSAAKNYEAAIDVPFNDHLTLIRLYTGLNCSKAELEKAKLDDFVEAVMCI